MNATLMRHAAALMSLVLAAPLGAQESCADGDGTWVVRACFDEPLTENRYGHDVLGGTLEWTRLRFDLGPLGQDQAGGEPVLTIRMRDMIIEDIAPRVSDLDSDARPEVVFVQSSYTRGARLAGGVLTDQDARVIAGRVRGDLDQAEAA